MKVLFDSCDYDTVNDEDAEEMAIDSLELLLVDLEEALNKSYSFLVVGSRYCSWRGKQGYSFKVLDTIKEAVLSCLTSLNVGFMTNERTIIIGYFKV